MATPIRPRLARYVAAGVALAVVIAAVAFLIVVPSTGPLGFSARDRWGTAILAAAIVYFLYRQASVRVELAADGVRVRNLLRSRSLEWAQIVAVTFAEGAPWVQLDLDDGTTLAVMGIQRADGAFALRQAHYLATLVATGGLGPDGAGSLEDGIPKG